MSRRCDETRQPCELFEYWEIRGRISFAFEFTTEPEHQLLILVQGTKVCGNNLGTYNPGSAGKSQVQPEAQVYYMLLFNRRFEVIFESYGFFVLRLFLTGRLVHDGLGPTPVKVTVLGKMRQ